MATKTLSNAKKAKADEFFTQLADIENELKHYKEHFKNKIVFCNCDDPYESNFFKYFAMNFNFLGLKKLIATCYDSSPIAYTQLSFIGKDRTTKNKNRRAYKIEISEVEDYNGDGAVDLSDVEYLLHNKENTLTLLNGDGDFRSEECVELLKVADIVVTNPPFSLFREYIAQLVEYNKKFIIIGNQNAITYKEVFKLFKENKIWLGYKCGDMKFTVPSYYEERTTRFWIDEKGQKWRSFGNICWYTNVDIAKRHEELTLYKHYYGHEDEYPKYDNYDAINVDKVADIPCDYFEDIGVPITYLDKYNSDQFEIVKFRKGNDEKDLTYTSKSATIYQTDRQTDRQTLRRRITPYFRIVIRRKV